MAENYLGEKIPKLGFGLMRLPMIGEDIDLEQTKKMVDTFLAKGFTYFDTAYVYGDGKSENAARDALVRRYPRESFQLTSKLPLWAATGKDDLERYFSKSLERAGVEYFDFYLLHGLMAGSPERYSSSNLAKAEKFGAWEFIQKKKAEGRIRHIGFSFHDTAEVLDRVLTEHPEAEFVQLQINYADWDDEKVQSRRCYETARKHDVPVVIMEPVKGGTLASLRPGAEKILQDADPQASPASWAIRFCASLEGVVTVLSGMSDLGQLNDNVSYMQHFRAMNDQERGVLKKVVRELHSVETIGCTACRYCADGCPQKINIPAVFELTNNYRIYGGRPDELKMRYRDAVEEGGKASDCIACGSCERHCPQKLPIIGLLKESAKLFEGVER